MKINGNAIVINVSAIVLLLSFSFLMSCKRSSHQQMISILKELNKKHYTQSNPFTPEATMVYYDSLLSTGNYNQDVKLLAAKASLALKVGQEEQSVQIYEDLSRRIDFMSNFEMLPEVGIAYMRLGERNNCMLSHNGS